MCGMQQALNECMLRWIFSFFFFCGGKLIKVSSFAVCFCKEMNYNIIIQVIYTYVNLYFFFCWNPKPKCLPQLRSSKKDKRVCASACARHLCSCACFFWGGGTWRSARMNRKHHSYLCQHSSLNMPIPGPWLSYHMVSYHALHNEMTGRYWGDSQSLLFTPGGCEQVLP